MCGIIGVASRGPVTNREWIKAGCDTMTHRGPDDAGEWWSDDGRVGFAHRRLAIIDLSPSGRQPMHDSTARKTIVFNGEIYNHHALRDELRSRGYRFHTHSDTEVILAAYNEWGKECLAHLNGMFAFALFDHAAQKIFMARDRAGEKPLFYSWRAGELRFASELKGLMAAPDLSRKVNADAMDCYLAMGFVPGQLCMLEGVNKLPPAHALEFDLGTGAANTWRYWGLPDVIQSPFEAPDEDALLDELDTLLEDSVRRQLVADVPVGVLLSGGMDSSLITAMASRVSPHVKTFTVGFQGSRKHDESEHARLIARHFGTEHFELEAGAVDVDLLPVLARQYDEPMIDSSMIPTCLVSKLIREHCTVALGGDGGDELFGGYTHYNRLLWMQHKFGWVPRRLRQFVSWGAEQVLPTGFKGRNWLQALGTNWESELPLIGTFFDSRMRRRLLGGEKDIMAAERIRESRIPETTDLLERATRMEFENYMPEDILVKVDRASMLNSLEIRAPLLDRHMIEFAYGRVPSPLKATLYHRKIILKKLAERILPPEFDRYRKQGFSIPIDEWLKQGKWREFFHDILLSRQCCFDQKAILALFRGQDAGRYNQERLFGLLMFELWRREYQIAV